MSKPAYQMQIVDNVFVKMIRLNEVGDLECGHSHTFDHITMLSTGAVLMRANGQEVEHVAPKLIVTPKGIKHEFEAIQPNTTLCCIHAIRDGDDVDDVAPQDVPLHKAMDYIKHFPLAVGDDGVRV